MLSVLFLVLATTLGYYLTKKFFSFLSSWELLAIGWVIGVLVSTWLTVLSVTVLQYSVGFSIAFLIMILLIKKLRDSKTIKIQILPSKNLIIFVAVWGTLFGWLFFHSSLRIEPDGWHTAPYTYGDLALHTSIINYFSHQPSFSLQHPLLNGSLNTYPFLLDFHTAILTRFGASIQSSLILTGVLTMLASLVLFYQVAYQLTKKSSTPWMASVLFFLNGGAGWWILFRDWAGWRAFWETLLSLPIDYTNSQSDHLFWTNITTTHILPQRGFMIGLAVLLVVLRLLQVLWQQKKIQTAQLVFIGTLIGLTPLFHAHSFLFLTPLFVWILWWAVTAKKVKLETAIIAVISSLVFGGLQLFYLLQNNHSSIQEQWGWLAQDNWLVFWLKNMGTELAVLLVFPVIYFFSNSKNSFERTLIIPCLTVYALCNLFIFQANAWDNMKFMSLAFLPLSFIAAAVLTKHFEGTWKKIIVFLFLVVSSASGLLSIVYVSQNDWVLIDKQSIQIGYKVTQLTPADSLFLTSDSHNHLVPMVAGRRIVLGYRGWLWTHGVDYSNSEELVNEIYSGGENAQQLIETAGIDYIFIGPQERGLHYVNQKFFEENYPKIFDQDQILIYQINKI